MSAPLQFFQSGNYTCRIGTGSYEIIYPFSGSYPAGTVPKFNALYMPEFPASGSALGQFDTLEQAQAACQAHFDQLPP